MSTLLRIAAGGAGLAASLVVRQLLKTTWRHATDKEPPEDPTSKRHGLGEALAWTAVSAAAIAATQLLVRRGIEA